ncbi:MAG: gamma-carboxymuconolactone decarboxylase [Rhodospirillaceae bacterium]|jgi:4-carboxymuconolactone decarboxylase|nr:gamma-carboxymuconolactone decarboxylase [Rhodospirillaceae bacterium]MBT4486287.1 gamma-carboxymuconolactone decarboxylase [Rhodospirillaceae bacterium]MBT5194678.1 gamma-carboxymuconolactone decarboxylase [Rhodospirillaceae bacterium]MBT5895785.1 gamma-carboxymuconolactone decarboxylase [Rhodospirillaceae bacterium]MBT6428546.1 gamma-carboxymuconolactone decarboxylase [Rhodospirillaceae bacterium]
MSDSSEKREKGKALARILLKGSDAGFRVPRKFSGYSLEHLFGDVWQGEELSLEERSLVTCTILVALNREAEQRIHFRAAQNLGLPRERIEGMIIHAAHYAGWPVAASAFRILAEVWPEDEEG